MTLMKKAALAAVPILFVSWAAGNFARISESGDGVVRMSLGALYAFLIVVRWKHADSPTIVSDKLLAPLGLAAALLSVAGVVLLVRQFEWLGVIVLMFVLLRWALPRRYSRDTALALFVLYWVHPLPGQVFGGFQALMQTWSVQASEWILQALNVRVWADGSVLRTGFWSFSVPDECSGMRTAVTVLLSAVGVGILVRLKPWRIFVLMCAGTAQVVALNVVRIVAMVLLTPMLGRDWAGSFLHDSLGILLAAGVFIVQVEAGWWHLRRTRAERSEAAIEAGMEEPPERATVLPRSWKILSEWRWAFVFGIVAVAMLAGAIYKRRPMHRAAMLEGVVQGLMATDKRRAEVAAIEGMALDPSNRMLRRHRVWLLIQRKEPQEAMNLLDPLGKDISAEDVVLRSWCLMDLGRVDEASVLLDGLPEGIQNAPTVALLRAMQAARQSNVSLAAQKTVVASRSHLTVPRARELFPFLARHEQWAAIADSGNPDVQFASFELALLALHANLRMNRIAQAGDLARQMLSKWPSDYRILTAVEALALSRPGGEWENLFAEMLEKHIRELDADRLAAIMPRCFDMGRPDLGWLVFARLHVVSPDDPALYYTPVEQWRRWFAFSRKRLVLPASGPYDMIDIGGLIRQTRTISPLRSLWVRIPLGREFAGGDGEKLRRISLEKCLARYDELGRANQLTRRMRIDYPEVLMAAGRNREAYARIDELERDYPERRRETRLQRALLLQSEGRWQESYEQLAACRRDSPASGISVDEAMVAAMMNLNMGVAALELAQRTVRSYPGSPSSLYLVQSIWDMYGYKEQAFAMSSAIPEPYRNWPAHVRLMYETGRYKEAETLAARMGMKIAVEAGDRFALTPPPAEHALARKTPPALNGDGMAALADEMGKQARTAVSPFIRDLGGLMAQWYATKGRGDTGNIEKWIAIGRDDMERAVALEKLVSMLVRQRRATEASEAATKMTEFLPRSTVLWRTRIEVTAGDAAVVKRAREMCPSDPEIWLAWLVKRVRDERVAGEVVLADMEREVKRGVIPPRTFVRAADFLLRQGMPAAAAVAAKHACSAGGGLVSANIVGLRCALVLRDRPWAKACASRAAASAPDPAPFYRLLVNLGADEQKIDQDLISALEYLHERHSDDPRWVDILAAAHFRNGDMRRVLFLAEPMIEKSPARLQLQTLLLAAEAARQEARHARAVGILRAANGLYPGNVQVLNNMVYTLAQDPGTLRDAEALVPDLLASGTPSAATLDTVASVYLKRGKMDKAEAYMAKALEKLGGSDRAAWEVNVNAAEIHYRMGRMDKAMEMLNAVLRDSLCPPATEVRARLLQDEIRRAMEAKKAGEKKEERR